MACISVNDEAVHGIPGARRLRDGDLVKLDVTAELDGFYADACITVPVGRSTPRDARLISAGSGAVRAGADGWTVRTADGARSAHVEHTIVIRDGVPTVLTA